MTKWFSVCVILLLTSVAQADVLPEEQWSEEVAVWLARAMVSEADWSTRDHIAIAWVLKRRWEARVQERPEWTFLDQVKKYCAGMRGEVRTSRHVWVRSLAPDGTEPDGWPSNAKWENYKPAWEKVLRLSKAWIKGKVKDPCPSASHWGGTMDHPDKSWKAVNCGPTQNIFYSEG